MVAHTLVVCTEYVGGYRRFTMLFGRAGRVGKLHNRAYVGGLLEEEEEEE